MYISLGVKILLKTFNRNWVRLVRFFNEMNFNFVYNWNLLFLWIDGDIKRIDKERCLRKFKSIAGFYNFPRTDRAADDERIMKYATFELSIWNQHFYDKILTYRWCDRLESVKSSQIHDPENAYGRKNEASLLCVPSHVPFIHSVEKLWENFGY